MLFLNAEILIVQQALNLNYNQSNIEFGGGDFSGMVLSEVFVT
jgi:hypothetical protein